MTNMEYDPVFLTTGLLSVKTSLQKPGSFEDAWAPGELWFKNVWAGHVSDQKSLGPKYCYHFFLAKLDNSKKIFGS